MKIQRYVDGLTQGARLVLRRSDKTTRAEEVVYGEEGEDRNTDLYIKGKHVYSLPGHKWRRDQLDFIISIYQDNTSLYEEVEALRAKLKAKV